MDKSHVSMEQHICPVCGITFDTNAILLDRRLRNNLDRYTVTGMSLCPVDQKHFDDGYVALVECDPEKSRKKNTIQQKDCHRTGRIMHMKREAFNRVFNVTIDPLAPMVFSEPEVLDKFQQ